MFFFFVVAVNALSLPSFPDGLFVELSWQMLSQAGGFLRSTGRAFKM